MARRLRFSRSTSAPPVDRISRDETGERPRATSNVDTKLNDVAPPALCKIIKDVGAHGKRQSRKEMEKRNSQPKSSKGSHLEIHKIVKDIGAHDPTISQKDTSNHSTTKAPKSSHPGIHKIIKEIGAHEQKQSQKEPPNRVHSKSVGSAHPEIQQIIKEVAMSERRRSQPNQGTQNSRPLSRRASLSFLRRSKSTSTPKSAPAPQEEVPAVPEVVVDSPISPATARSKRSASAPTRPSSDLLDAATLEALAISIMPPVRPARPSFTNATPRAASAPRQRSTSVGQYSLFPKPSPTPSPQSSPVILPILPVRQRATLPPIPSLPALNKESSAHKAKSLSTSNLADKSESQKAHMHKLSIQIPIKPSQPIPQVDPEQPPTRPTSSHSTASRKSKRVTFSETGPEVISISSRKSSPERRRTKSPQRSHASWSSVFLLSDPEKVERPSLSRHLSLPASSSRSSSKSSNRKSILRRSSSFHTNTVTEEEKTVPERIPENPMMVKNLKRLPRKNSRKTQPLPASLSGAAESSPQVEPPASATKYTRHPIIVPIATAITTSSPSLASTPSSTRSSYYSSSSAYDSSSSSRTSYSSSTSSEDNMFRTVSEPVRFSKNATSIPPPPPLPIQSAAMSVMYDDSPTLGTLPVFPSSAAKLKTVNSWGSGPTAAKAAAAHAQQKQREGKWLKSSVHRRHSANGRAEYNAPPPPVPPLPASVGAY
ncbi:unnamed protein product [Periconia digitata]|uniref:Uncharacterized protein n=1 Tax=Periconia digitata TaxID=1303443 RepID=A0A9W4UGA7_9PLEO|nr:unnamed protein product [Periconia digitata]